MHFKIIINAFFRIKFACLLTYFVSSIYYYYYLLAYHIIIYPSVSLTTH